MKRQHVRRSFGVFTVLALSVATLALGGCVIVVDGDHDGYSSSWNYDSHQPRIGVEISQPGPALAKQLCVDRDQTTLIDKVYSGSPADRAGVQKFDVITQVDGKTDASPSSLRKAIRSKSAGESVGLRILRDGKPLDVDVAVSVSEKMSIATDE